MLLVELATFLASGTSKSDIIELRSSLAVVERDNELLEVNRCSKLNDCTRQELAQFEMAKTLSRLVKARIRNG